MLIVLCVLLTCVHQTYNNLSAHCLSCFLFALVCVDMICILPLYIFVIVLSKISVCECILWVSVCSNVRDDMWQMCRKMSLANFHFINFVCVHYEAIENCELTIYRYKFKLYILPWLLSWTLAGLLISNSLVHIFHFRSCDQSLLVNVFGKAVHQSQACTEKW